MPVVDPRESVRDVSRAALEIERHRDRRGARHCDRRSSCPRSPRNLSKHVSAERHAGEQQSGRRDARAAHDRARTRDRWFRRSDRIAARGSARRRNREKSEGRLPSRVAAPRRRIRRRSASGSCLRVREERSSRGASGGPSRRWTSTKSPSGVSHRSTRVGSGGRGRKNLPQSVCAWPPGYPPRGAVGILASTIGRHADGVSLRTADAAINNSPAQADGSSNLWREEERGHAKSAAVLRRASHQDAFRRSERARGVARRAQTIRSEVRARPA